MSIIVAIIILSFIIFFHELGHFIVAKRCNVKVNEFCLGLGPTILHKQVGETTYSLKLLPFGGACMMEGEDAESDDDRAFNAKPLWQRFAIVAAGPVFNFILAYVLAVILVACVGYDIPRLSGVMEDYPAQAAGLEEGDIIISLNGYKIHFFSEISVYNYFHEGETLEVVYERDGVRYTTTLVPQYNEESGSYYMGIYGDYSRVKVGPLGTLAYGFYEIKYQIYTTLESLSMLVTGSVAAEDISGPVGIVSTIGETYTESLSYGVYNMLMSMISISILLSANLGLTNL